MCGAGWVLFRFLIKNTNRKKVSEGKDFDFKVANSQNHFFNAPVLRHIVIISTLFLVT